MIHLTIFSHWFFCLHTFLTQYFRLCLYYKVRKKADRDLRLTRHWPDTDLRLTYERKMTDRRTDWLLELLDRAKNIYQKTAKMSQESMKLVIKARRVYLSWSTFRMKRTLIVKCIYLHFQSRIVTKTSFSNRVFFLLTLNSWVLDWPVLDTIRFLVFFL